MQAGDEEAFTILYRHYSPKLYLNIFSMVHDQLAAEEMVQELFTRIWQKRKSEAITENFEGYIYRIAQNLVHDFFRKLKRDRRLFEQFKSRLEGEYKHTEEALNFKHTSAVLQEAIRQLPPQQKKVYELVKEKGLTYKKTAEILGISPLTVKEYLGYTTKSIRNYFLSHTDHTLLLILFSLFCL